MSSDRFQYLRNKFLFILRRHSTLYDLPFQSYDQSENVTVWQSYVDKPISLQASLLKQRNLSLNFLFLSLKSIKMWMKRLLTLMRHAFFSLKLSIWLLLFNQKKRFSFGSKFIIKKKSYHVIDRPYPPQTKISYCMNL